MDEVIQNRKSLGKYYTPREVAQALTDWAIATPDTVALDPSFGGCAFLYSALRTLQQLGGGQPGRSIYGVDIDPGALDYVQPLLDAGGSVDQFVISDFFDIKPNHFDAVKFGAVIGNPPYVRHHTIDNATYRKAMSCLREEGLSIPGRASCWAFFVLHSLNFLQRGGRMAMVLPGSFLHADYAAPVREHVAGAFRRVTLLLIQERVFADTQEETVILLAEGRGEANEGIWVGEVDSASSLRTICKDMARYTIPIRSNRHNGRWLRGLIDTEVLGTFDSLCDSPQVVRLGDWAMPRIGVVTGNNRFFIISKAVQLREGIPGDHVRPIISRAHQLQGICMRQVDVEHISCSGKSSLLVSPPAEGPLPRSLSSYLSEGEQKGVADRQKCASRFPWYVVPGTWVPDAFIHYMTATWPRVVINESEATCTNAIHRLSWRQRCSRTDKRRIALGSLSTLTQLSAELVGRSYGGGVLKVELGEVSQLAVPVETDTDVDKLYWGVDELLRRGEIQMATDIVDSAFLIGGMGLTGSQVAQMREGRDRLHDRRTNHRPGQHR